MFISIVRQCLHEETIWLTWPAKLIRKRTKTTVIQSTELKWFMCLDRLGGLSTHNLHRSKSLWSCNVIGKQSAGLCYQEWEAHVLSDRTLWYSMKQRPHPFWDLTFDPNVSPCHTQVTPRLFHLLSLLNKQQSDNFFCPWQSFILFSYVRLWDSYVIINI